MILYLIIWYIFYRASFGSGAIQYKCRLEGGFNIKLNKKFIIILALLEFIFIIAIYMIGSMQYSKSLGIGDLVFLVFVSLASALLINILFIGFGRIIKLFFDK